MFADGPVTLVGAQAGVPVPLKAGVVALAGRYLGRGGITQASGLEVEERSFFFRGH